ncbi:tripartite tricarboxylate transporter TctB family protein [Thermodesulfobacteriota bacterium]
MCGFGTEVNEVDKNDLVTGLVLLVFAVTIFIGSFKYTFGEIITPGAGFVPRIASMVLILICGFIVGKALMGKKRNGPAHQSVWARGKIKRVAIAAGIFLTFRLSFPLLGFVPTNFLFFLLITRLLGHFSWKRSFIFSCVTTICTYVLFQVWLKIQMPTSIFGI